MAKRSYETRAGQRSPEGRARNPKKVRGVRLRLRTELRKMGIVGRFSTDFARRPPWAPGHNLGLVISCRDAALIPLIEARVPVFEGYPVKAFRRPESA